MYRIDMVYLRGLYQAPPDRNARSDIMADEIGKPARESDRWTVMQSD